MTATSDPEKREPRIAALEARIATLEARVATLEAPSNVTYHRYTMRKKGGL